MPTSLNRFGLLVAAGFAATLVTAAPPPNHPSTDDAAGILKLTETTEYPFQGRVLETIDSNSYTYIRVRQPKHEMWLAAPRLPLREGQRIRFPRGKVMVDFYSRKLKRTFDAVLFVRDVIILPPPTCSPPALLPWLQYAVATLAGHD